MGNIDRKPDQEVETYGAEAHSERPISPGGEGEGLRSGRIAVRWRSKVVSVVREEELEVTGSWTERG